MQTYVGPGDTIDYTNGGSAIVAGQLVPVANLIGVAAGDIANGATGVLYINGVFDVAKVSAAVIGQGEKVVLDVSQTPDAFDDDQLSAGTGDITNGAIAVAAAASGATTVRVRLNPGSGVVN